MDRIIRRLWRDNGEGYARSVITRSATDIAQRIVKLSGNGRGALLAEQMEPNSSPVATAHWKMQRGQTTYKADR